MSTRTNERPGVRAKLSDARFSAYKAREVLDLVRGEPVGDARNILDLCDRGAAEPIAKLLDSAVANAANNNDIPPEELYVGACYADEGATLKRWRPRARGRATRINKRTCHITIIVSRFSGDEMEQRRARDELRGRVTGDARAERARRVSRSRAAEQDDADTGTEEASDETVESQDADLGATATDTGTETDVGTASDTDSAADTESDGDEAEIEEIAEATAEDGTDDDVVEEAAAEAVADEAAADEAAAPEADAETEEKN